MPVRRYGRYPHKKKEVDGILFDSTAEADVYVILKRLAAEGRISDLKRQVPYELIPEVREEYVKHLKTKDKVLTRQVQKNITYVADFVYLKDGRKIVMDVKSKATAGDPVFQLKKKMMRAILGISVDAVIVGAKTDILSVLP